jgi:integrase
VIDWDDLTLDFYRDYKQFFIEKDYKPNTIARHIKNMKTMLYAAKDLHLTTRDDFMSKQWSADREDVDNIYITEERLRQMYDFDMMDYQRMKLRSKKFAKNDEEKDKLVHALKRDLYRQKLSEARDIFLMGCFTGQRVSDYKRINTDMIRTLDDGNDYIYLQQEKTAKWIYIPLDIRVRAILSKYGGRLPKIYDQDLNERIKVIGRILGWRENAGITELHGMMEVPTQKKFYECIKTHTARRTFATNAYKRKISLSSIMVITGHSSEKMLRKYLKLDKEEQAILAAAEFAKAKEVKLKKAE